eukprot:TRINITY_DN32613_c0_g1_i1.p1 TRINITY_DN32613_c0_g1~~TRINITY_DN32613_c0_g1_i1.p1  ORF type:complete len:963 (-),score=170.76 TRINITY_DN32613_c0_g1_i1:174-3062(-)
MSGTGEAGVASPERCWTLKPLLVRRPALVRPTSSKKVRAASASVSERRPPTSPCRSPQRGVRPRLPTSPTVGGSPVADPLGSPLRRQPSAAGQALGASAGAGPGQTEKRGSVSASLAASLTDSFGGGHAAGRRKRLGSACMSGAGAAVEGSNGRASTPSLQLAGATSPDFFGHAGVPENSLARFFQASGSSFQASRPSRPSSCPALLGGGAGGRPSSHSGLRSLASSTRLDMTGGLASTAGMKGLGGTLMRTGSSMLQRSSSVSGLVSAGRSGSSAGQGMLAAAGTLRGTSTGRLSTTAAELSIRPSSSPGGGAMASTARSHIPNFSPTKLEALVVDKARQRTFPPQLRDHLELHKLLQKSDYKRCIERVVEVIRQAEEKGPGSQDETPEEAAVRMYTAECGLVGAIEDGNTRQVLMLWTLGVSLEGVGQARMAILVFSKCCALDPTNPIHPYHRGCCLLRTGSAKAACADFDLAVELCRERETEPPLVFLASRALAGRTSPDSKQRTPDVLQDFESARQRAQCPDYLPPRLVPQEIADWDEYKEMVTQPVPPEGPCHHWVAVLVARCHMRYTQKVTDMEARSFIRFLRGLPGMASMSQAVVMKRFPEFSTRFIREGQVFLLENYWYCVLEGSFDVVRFGRPAPPGEVHKALMKSKDKEEPAAPGSELEKDPLGMPADMLEVPELQICDTLPPGTILQGGDTFGELKDGWLVAGEGGTELLCLKKTMLRSFARRCQGLNARVDADVSLLQKSGLFKSCPTHVLLTMVSEMFDEREAFVGEDPMTMDGWDGLVIIRKGQLQLWDECAVKGLQSLSPTNVSPKSPVKQQGPPSPRSKTQLEELCNLGPGDFLGDERLLGGGPAITFAKSKVLSHRLEAWILPKSRLSDAEDVGFIQAIKEHREQERRALLERAKAANSWAKHRPQALTLARCHRRTIDYVRGEVHPTPKAVGGMCCLFSERELA